MAEDDRFQQAVNRYQDGQSADAVVLARIILVDDPTHAEAHHLLGVIALEQGHGEEAARYFGAAIRHAPAIANYHFSLGNAYLASGRMGEAIASFRQSLRLDPDCAEAHSNLAQALLAQGRGEEALVACRAALSLRPGHAGIHSNLIQIADLLPAANTAELQAERRRWCEQCVADAVQPTGHVNTADSDRRLRIGYVSADFRRHSAAVGFGAMLTRFDRDGFEVVVYSQTLAEDDLSRLFRQSVTDWRNIRNMDDEAVAGQIRWDGIDILVDLSGHSGGNRLSVFARKPAPIQISAWGYAGGTGLETVDALFSDPVVIPPDECMQYAEEVCYLPCAIGAFFAEGFPEVGPLPALSSVTRMRSGLFGALGFLGTAWLGTSSRISASAAITFGSFNRLAKLSPEVIRLWAKILQVMPSSRMLLKAADLDDAEARQRIVAWFNDAGIDPHRLTLMGRSSLDEHRAAFNRVDIALDPFPQSGGVTTLEALMMGVPVLTLRGNTFVGRGSASILTTLGLEDWIAESEEEYVEIALKKAENLKELAELRRQVRYRLQESIIGDTEAYVREVEKAYRKLWREWCLASGGQCGQFNESR